MKSVFLYFISFLLLVSDVSGQSQYLDSLRTELYRSSNDTLTLVLLKLLAANYREPSPDSSLYYAEKGLALANKMNLKFYQSICLGHIAYAQMNKGFHSRSLQSYISALDFANNPKAEENMLSEKWLAMSNIDGNITPIELRKGILGLLHHDLGILYENTLQFDKELFHLRIAKNLQEEIKDSGALGATYYVLGRVYLSLQKPDSALILEKKAYDITVASGSPDPSWIVLNIGKCYLAMGNIPLATEYLREAISSGEDQNYLRGVVASQLLLSDICRQEGKIDSALYFSKASLKLSQQMKVPDLLLRSYSSLAGLYGSTKHYDSSTKYQALMINIKDSVFNSRQIQQFQNIEFDDQQRLQELEAAQKAYRNKVQVYVLIAGLITILLFSFILLRNYLNKQKAYALLKKQKAETDFQKARTEETLEELRTTQAQLVQREKMASLGELTAGIAHEIQNPLNFVNNFSEVNLELFREMKQAMQGGNASEAMTVANTIEQNLDKVNHHGKRADAIVKGMLQHSRASTGLKEPTDINLLADEYLRLSYRGFQAKDFQFHAKILTDFDQQIGKINIVSQEIGHVLLNIYNNAFYAMNERKKMLFNGYEPTIMVTTRLVNAAHSTTAVKIMIEDNGSGIPEKILDKIFQPFFTSKPSGQGTGLGLSLSFDIVTKGHGGELRVETKEGSGANFIIQIPVTS